MPVRTLGELILNAWTKKSDQAEEAAKIKILNDLMSSSTETQGRGANTDEINRFLASQTTTPTPMPETYNPTPTPMGSMTPSLMGNIPNPNTPPKYNPTFQTQGEKTGLTPDQIDPAALGKILGLTQEVQKDKSRMQMVQQAVTHPGFKTNMLPEIMGMIDQVTGKPVEPYTLSEGQQRRDAQNNIVAEVPAIERNVTAKKKTRTEIIDLGDRKKVVDYEDGVPVRESIELKGIEPKNPDNKVTHIDYGDRVVTEIRDTSGRLISTSVEKKGIAPKQSTGTKSGGKSSSAFNSFKETQKYIDDNGMPGYVPSQTASGKWVTKLQTGKKTGGTDWNAAPATAQSAGQQSGMVRVRDKNGVTGSIPSANLKSALSAGYTQIQ